MIYRGFALPLEQKSKSQPLNGSVSCRATPYLSWVQTVQSTKEETDIRKLLKAPEQSRSTVDTTKTFHTEDTRSEGADNAEPDMAPDNA